MDLNERRFTWNVRLSEHRSGVMFMKKATLQSIVLAKQGLTSPKVIERICHDLNGLQAQFPSYAHLGFFTRLPQEAFQSGEWQEKLVRQWSVRGTVHAYLKKDIPLYLHEGMRPSRDYLVKETREGLAPVVKQTYHDLILQALSEHALTRDELKNLCRTKGVSKEHEQKLFNPWGGLLRYMVERGEIYQEYGERRFHLLKPIHPWSKEEAELEIARRYFTGFGPVSLADAQYYFKRSQKTIKGWMSQLSLQTIQVDGEDRYYMGNLQEVNQPVCLFIAGFDQLLLGYEKKSSLFFNPKFIRQIYTLTGIVKPTVFYRGRLVATWKLEKKSVVLDVFDELSLSECQELESYRQEWQKKLLAVY